LKVSLAKRVKNHVPVATQFGEKRNSSAVLQMNRLVVPSVYGREAARLLGRYDAITFTKVESIIQSMRRR
jgi:hypothetical protein